MKPKNGSLELQGRCAEQSSRLFKESGFTPKDLAKYEDHYDVKFNKCFVIFESTDAKTTPGTIWTTNNLYDAFEGTTFGEYAWHSDKVKKYWEVKPANCHVILESGKNKHCESEDEFKELIKSYISE